MTRRADALVFALVLLGVGWFHQGGGWNQNARFALVRAIVEEGTFFIDDYLLYEHSIDPASPRELVRVPIRNGNFERSAGAYAMAWRGSSGALLPVDPASAGTRELVAVDDVAVSGDVAYYAGHFHPNKAPATSWLAVPGYVLIRTVESLIGVSPDSWSALTINAWLVSVLSVGLVTALAAVFVLRLARRLGSETAALAAALSFAFATMAWPYGSFLFEHNVIAAALVASLWLIERAREQGAQARPQWSLVAAGALAGFAAITNYVMAVVVALYGLYVLVRLARREALAWYAAGVFWPLLAICAYNAACFGTPFTTNYAHQSPMFTAESRVLGVFALPRLDVLVLLLVSPFRGLFFTSPVLLAAVAGLVVLWRERTWRPWAWLIAAVAGFLLLVNASFNGWDGGWTAVPRYLGPAMALLAVPLAVAFDRWRAITCALAAVSVVVQLLLVSVDPQVPIGDVGNAGIAVSKVFTIDPMTRYVVPLFVEERPWPLLDDAIEQAVARSARVAAGRGDAPADIERKSQRLRADLHARIEHGESAPFDLAGVVGPVSANPIGICEGYYYRLFPAYSDEADGNSFNAGEFLFPQSRLSLLPLFLLAGALLMLLFQPEEDEETEAAAPAAAPSGSGAVLPSSPSVPVPPPARTPAPAPQKPAPPGTAPGKSKRRKRRR